MGGNLHICSFVNKHKHVYCGSERLDNVDKIVAEILLLIINYNITLHALIFSFIYLFIYIKIFLLTNENQTDNSG